MIQEEIDSIDIAYDLINDVDKFEKYLDEIDNDISDEVYNRLESWICFFNENFQHHPCIYSSTIFSLFEAAKQNKLFQSQTRFEFKTSLSFYERIFDLGYFLKFNKLEEASYFLKVSLVYGCYPGMVRCSLKSAVIILSRGCNLDNLHELFIRLFVKYEIPTVLTKNLTNLNISEVEALMFVLQGNNIRLFDKLPLPLSKKESFIFINKLPTNLKFKDSVLERAIVCSKLLLNSSSTDLLVPTIKSSKIFDLKLFTFYDDLPFWKKVLKLLNQIDWKQDNVFSVQEYIDYFEFKRYSCDDEYYIENRSVESINRALLEWHERGLYGKLLNKVDLKWDGNNFLPFKFEQDNEQYLITEITNGKELFKEADYLHHCVYQYIEYCADGLVSVFSLSKKSDMDYLPFITIEVRNNCIVQVAGKRNRKVNSKEMEIINEWAKQVEFIIDLDY